MRRVPWKRAPGGRPASRARRPQPPGTMNKTEEKFAAELLAQLKAGEILDYGFETVKLRLAQRTHYTPDFHVVDAAGEFHFYEIKGHWEDDARVKIKVAAEKYWFWHFWAVKRKGGEWLHEHIPPK